MKNFSRKKIIFSYNHTPVFKEEIEKNLEKTIFYINYSSPKDDTFISSHAIYNASFLKDKSLNKELRENNIYNRTE